jgi:hypothetical protein
MADKPSLFEELRTQYEASRQITHDAPDVEDFQHIDGRLRNAFRWLERAVAYLDQLKPPVAHRYDLGHGLIFDALRFGRGFVGQHTGHIVGYTVVDEINIYYEIDGAAPLTVEIDPVAITLAEQSLDDVGMKYSCRRIEDHGGAVRKCVVTVPPAIPASVCFRADYQTGLVNVALVNADRFDRVALEFHSTAIDESVLDDLLRFMLGRDTAFLRRAPLAGIHGRAGG